MNKFLGYDIKYWIELQQRAEELELVDTIQEIAALRAKVSFYESRIQQLSKFMETEIEVIFSKES